MECQKPGLPAAIVFAWLAVALAPSAATAQAPERLSDPDTTASVDPPDTFYQTGALENDPEVERGLPLAERHRAFLPVAVDISSRLPPVGNQGHSQSCVAWATAYAARSYYTGALERRDISQLPNLPSPSYVYHLARVGGCDAGTNIGRVAGVLKSGALSLADSPFTDQCVPPAPPELVSQAHDFRVRGFIRVDYSQVNDVKGQLARSNPVLIDFRVSTAFHKLRGADTFTEPGPPPGDPRSGWHFMTLVGYDEQRQAFRLMNSWGKGWGDHGYAWISYDLLKTRIRGTYVLDVGPLRPQPVVNPPPRPQPSPRPPIVHPQPVVQPVPPRPAAPVPPAPVAQPVPPKPLPAVPPPLLPQPSPPPPPPIAHPQPVVQPAPPNPAPAVPLPSAPLPAARVHPGVALVVGNGAYAGGQIATSAADADVVAETMRAAGYQVTELYDTRQDEIGGALRSFLDQVAAAGPDAVAFFYFAGYVAQAAGQNYLVPVDATIAGVGDVALQALHVDDLVAELAKLPAAARVIVLDAAREHGYGRGRADLVPPGLATMSAPAGMTIAFPAAPGRIAAENAGPYSLYTATLVRLMRQTDVDLARIFTTTRQQVGQLSQGRQTPWTTGHPPADIVLFQAAPSPEPTVVPPSPAPAPVTPIPGLRLADLQTLSCGHINVRADGDRSVLNGYVATDDDLNRVKLIAGGVPRTSLGDVTVAPWPQCEALQTLEKPLLVDDRPAIDIGGSRELRSGDPLRIEVRSPGQISYLYVSYIQADGSVVHLVQPNALVPEPTLPRQTLVFGSGEGGKPKFTVGPPFGREMIIAIASRSPLFDHELPAQQPEREYLSDLRRALLYKPVPTMPDRELAATILNLQTSAR
jgi:hypothetical protein